MKCPRCKKNKKYLDFNGICYDCWMDELKAIRPKVKLDKNLKGGETYKALSIACLSERYDGIGKDYS